MTIVKITNSRTYKIKVQEVSDHALYFTIVGLENPHAFFVNSKDMKSFYWLPSLMTSYAKQLKAGESIEKIISDMKDTFDLKGFYLIPDGSGRKVNSIIHHLGLILETHVYKCKKEINYAKCKR